MARSGVAALAGVVLAALLAASCAGGGAQRTPTPGPSSPASVRPAGTPAATFTAAPASAPEIACVGPHRQDIWVVASDGAGKRNLTQSRCPRPLGPYWSPKGDRIACIGTGSAALPHTGVMVFDLEGRLALQIQHATGLTGPYVQTFVAAGPGELWSPDGEHLVYVIAELRVRQDGPEATVVAADYMPVLYIADAARGIVTCVRYARGPHWSPDGDRLVYVKVPEDTLALRNVATGEERVLAEGLVPLSWVMGGEAVLVAADYEEILAFEPDYTVSLFHLTTGEMTPVPQLDNGTQFWISPDGRTAAFLASPSEQGRGMALALLDLATGSVTPILGSAIASTNDRVLPSDHVPPSHVAFSQDGSHIYWTDITASGATIYKVNVDGGGLAKIGELQGISPSWASFSPDLMRVLYRAQTDSGAWGLWLANIDGSGAVLLEKNAGRGVWRPLPSMEEPASQ